MLQLPWKRFSISGMFAQIRATTGIIFRTLVVPWPGFLFSLIVLGCISGLVPVLQIKAIGTIVDTLAAHRRIGKPAGLTFYLPWVLLFASMQLIELEIQSRSFLTYLGKILDKRVREYFYLPCLQRALHMPLESFESTAFTDHLEHIRETFRGDLAESLLELQRFVVIVITMISILWQLGTVSLLLPAILIPGTIGLSRLRVQLSRLLWQMNFEQTSQRRQQNYWRSLLIERLPGAEVRLFGLQQHILNAWRQLSQRHLQKYKQASQRYFIRQIPVIILSAGMSSSSFLLLLWFVSRGMLSPGQFMGLLYVVWQYEGEIGILGQRLEAFFKLTKDLHVAEEFLALKEEDLQSGNPPPLLKQDGVRFTNVSFCYPGSQAPVLDAITLHLPPGKKIALVGENGAGKSTLARLLIGLYRPTQGTISIEGVALETLNLGSWRQHVGAILQDFMRYSFTVRENIGLSQIERLYDQSAIEGAARASGADTFISQLPQTYETQLGKEFEKSSELSGGQWQKLAVARAYFRNADLLVLDEPSSALDPLAEFDLYRQFLALSAEKTVLFISHRLGSAQLADQILFLERGKIIESGTHKELIAKGGVYAKFYALQAEWYRDRSEQEANVNDY